MDINIRRRKTNPAAREKTAAMPPRGTRVGEWGRVEAAHSGDNTIDVFLASGVYLERVPVASREWVVSGRESGRDWNSGERDLPPVHARVFVLMPSLSFDDCFALPFSGFSTIDQTAPFLARGEEGSRERITPSGWRVTDDRVNGSYGAVSPDGKTHVEIDYGSPAEPKDNPKFRLSVFDDVKVNVTAGNKATVRIFDTEIVIQRGKVLLKPKETAIEVDGNATVKTSGNATVEAAGDATVKGANVTVDAAGTLTLKTGDAAPWMPNIMPACPLGPTHGGPQAGVIRLRGA